MKQNNKIHKFLIELLATEGFPNSAYFLVPFKTEEEYGTRARVKVKVTIDGYQYRSSIVPMGLESHALGVRKEILKTIGKKAGDIVEVIMEQDIEPRVVTIPDDFLDELNKNPMAKSNFEKMSYSHQREYVQSINEAKKEITRQKRIQKAIEMLSLLK
jgi:hypothetical protein